MASRCPICGEFWTGFDHRCDQKTLDRIDAAHEAAEERAQRERRRSFGERLDEGFRMGRLSTPDEPERD